MPAHAAGVAAHRARVVLVEADGQAGARDHDDVVARVDAAHGDELVVVADLDRDDAVGLDRRVVGEELGLLDGARRVAKTRYLPSVKSRVESTDWMRSPSRSGSTLTSARPFAVREASGSS